MVDTVRTKTALLALMPLEVEGFSGQDIRDLVVSSMADIDTAVELTAPAATTTKIPVIDTTEGALADQFKYVLEGTFEEVLGGGDKVVRSSVAADADADIQAAIVAANTGGGGRVLLAPTTSSYVITAAEGPDVLENVTLDLNGQTVDWTNNTVASTNCAIRVKPGGHLTNGRILSSGALQTGAPVILRGVDQFLREKLTTVNKLRIDCGDGTYGAGPGIYLLADRADEIDSSSYNYINWVNFSDINISYAVDALRLESVNDFPVNYVNSNMFTRIGIDKSKRGIYCSSEFNDGAVDGNKFSQISFETVTGAATDYFAYFKRCSDNEIEMCEIWDYQAYAITTASSDGTGVEFDTGAAFNTVRCRLGSLTNPDLFFNGANKRANVYELTGRNQNGRAFFGVNDPTPSVYNGEYFFTNNSGATTITDFDDGYMGKRIRVKVNDANTTIEFSNANLSGNGGVDRTMASGDWIEAWYDSGVWYCTVGDA